MASNPPPIPNVFAYSHRYLLQDYIEKNNAPYGHIPRSELPKFTEMIRKRNPSDLPVCIIGAGAAGLYTAMILHDLGIKYQIIEANNRVGGRVATYKFPNGEDSDYFDYGAMRYPDTPFMKRTFDLFRKRKLQGINLIPYTLEMVKPPNTWLYFNSVRVNNRAEDVTGDPFKVSGYVKDQTLTTQEAVLDKLQQVTQPFRDLFRSTKGGSHLDISQAVAVLFKETNKFSLRSYMLMAKDMDPKDVNWCQTLSDAEGTFDLALTQYVLDSISWNWPTTPLGAPEEPPEDPNEGWWCLDGGSATLPYAMFSSLPNSAQKSTLFKRPVTAISHGFRFAFDSTPGDPPVPGHREKSKIVEVMEISVGGHKIDYSAVISTVPLPCLGLMDLSNSGLHRKYAQWNAIRALSYGTALRAGMKFTEAWWVNLPKPITGGESFTNLTIRNIKYPSYKTNVLIVTFVKLQDHERVASLINPDGSAKPGLLEVIFRDLAAVHGVEVNYLKDRYEDKPENFFAWDWSQDPTAMGYAYFSPGVYGDGDMYGALLEPAAHGRLFLAGDAASAAHAWVVGSLDSAWRAVNQYLTIHRPDLLEGFYDRWGATEYWDEPSDKASVDSYHELSERHLMIALQKDGIKPGSELPIPPEVLEKFERAKATA